MIKAPKDTLYFTCANWSNIPRTHFCFCQSQKWLLTSRAACDFVVLIPNAMVYNRSLSNLQLFFLINYSNLNSLYSSRYAGTDQSASGMITVTQEWPSLSKHCHPYSGLKQRDWLTLFPFFLIWNLTQQPCCHMLPSFITLSFPLSYELCLKSWEQSDTEHPKLRWKYQQWQQFNFLCSKGNKPWHRWQKSPSRIKPRFTHTKKNPTIES